MVGHKYVTLFFLKMLPAFYLYRDQEEFQDELTPDVPRVISPEMPIADSRTDSHLNGSDDGNDYQQWQSNQELVDPI